MSDVKGSASPRSTSFDLCLFLTVRLLTKDILHQNDDSRVKLSLKYEYDNRLQTKCFIYVYRFPFLLLILYLSSSQHSHC